MTATDDDVIVVMTSDKDDDVTEKMDVLGPILEEDEEFSHDGHRSSCSGYVSRKKPSLVRQSVSMESQRLAPTYQQAYRLTVLDVKEKHGPFYKAIPILPLPLAIVCCTLNVFLPGIGTLASAFALLCCGQIKHGKKMMSFTYNMLAGILQLLSALVIVGWIWSILWGMSMIQFAQQKSSEATVPYYVRKQSSVDTTSIVR